MIRPTVVGLALLAGSSVVLGQAAFDGALDRPAPSAGASAALVFDTLFDDHLVEGDLARARLEAAGLARYENDACVILGAKTIGAAQLLGMLREFGRTDRATIEERAASAMLTGRAGRHDLNRDGSIDSKDLAALLAAFGRDCGEVEDALFADLAEAGLVRPIRRIDPAVFEAITGRRASQPEPGQAPLVRPDLAFCEVLADEFAVRAFPGVVRFIGVIDGFGRINTDSSRFDCSLPGVNACGTTDLVGTNQGLGLVFRDGFLRSGGELTEVCLTDLGVYDFLGDGSFVAPNDGALIGRYMTTVGRDRFDQGFTSDPADDVPDLDRPDNDFRFDPLCWDTPPAGARPCDNGFGQAENFLWSGQVNNYYHITEFRKRWVDPFIGQLQIPQELKDNVLIRQHRPDLDLAGQGSSINVRIPFVTTTESTNFNDGGPFGVGIAPVQNTYLTTARSRTGYSNNDEKDPLGAYFDPGLVVGDYYNLLAYWLLGDNKGFPPSIGFFSNWEFRTVGSALADSFQWWGSYLVLDDPEAGRDLYFVGRTWENRTGEQACGGDNYACDKAPSIDNVMMFRQGDSNDPFTLGKQVFPFKAPVYPSGTPFGSFDGPSGGDLAAVYFAAVLYDIANEAGLGKEKTNLLFLQSVADIDDAYDNLTVPEYGMKIIEAARTLWPGDGTLGIDGQPKSVYEDDIVQVLVSRGMNLFGTADFQDLLPPRVGDGFPERFSPNPVEPRFFGSRHPERPAGGPSGGISNYGGFSWYFNEYTHPDPNNTIQYMAYQTYRHSKYGPCDNLYLTDGTVTPAPGFVDYTINNDGTYTGVLNGRFGNTIVFVPGTTTMFVTDHRRCPTEAEGYYVEDMRPFGWFMTEAMPNGFTIEPMASQDLGESIRHVIRIYDPSADAASNFYIGEATYSYEVIDHLGDPVQVNLAAGGTLDTVASFTLLKDEPFTIRVTRSRTGEADQTLELRESSTNFARNGRDTFKAAFGMD